MEVDAIFGYDKLVAAEKAFNGDAS